jgi:hypothetical protein
MGRGRAKAKQTKVARELKYNSHSTDFGALQRELSGHEPPEEVRPSSAEQANATDPYDEYVDKYAQYEDDEDESYVDKYSDEGKYDDYRR